MKVVKSMAAEDFIITRKRKKYKFARFADSPNCFEAEEFDAATRNSFIREASLVIELGAGSGLFSVELARRNPHARFIAVDVKADRLYQGATYAFAESVENIYFVRAHANQLTEVFDKQSVDTLWLTFPDPYPKKRHAKRRMTHQVFLEIYKNLLKPSGLFRFKTDNQELFKWSLGQLAGQKVQLEFISFDVHQDESASGDYSVMTTYEKRYSDEGKPIWALDASKFK